jgi:hypothetical protein
MLGTTAALSGVMGVTLTMAIGGADMPGILSAFFMSKLRSFSSPHSFYGDPKLAFQTVIRILL